MAIAHGRPPYALEVEGRSAFESVGHKIMQKMRVGMAIHAPRPRRASGVARLAKTKQPRRRYVDGHPWCGAGILATQGMRHCDWSRFVVRESRETDQPRGPCYCDCVVVNYGLVSL